MIDIDGTILSHPIHLENDEHDYSKQELLPGTVETLQQWWKDGHFIILITARKEEERGFTIEQMHKFGISYHHLIMGVPLGQRIVINDDKPYPEWEDIPTAVAFTVKRDKGIGHIQLEKDELDCYQVWENAQFMQDVQTSIDELKKCLLSDVCEKHMLTNSNDIREYLKNL